MIATQSFSMSYVECASSSARATAPKTSRKRRSSTGGLTSHNSGIQRSFVPGFERSRRVRLGDGPMSG